MASRSRVWKAALWLALIVAATILLPYFTSRVLNGICRVRIREQTSTLREPEFIVQTLPLRVACYNIAHGRGLPFDNWNGESKAVRARRLDEIAELLRESDADVVALNEVDFDSSWSHHENQAEYLATKAGFRYWVEQRNLDFRVGPYTWRFGNAILSRFPIRKAYAIEFPNYSKWETILAGKKRGVFAEIELEEEGAAFPPVAGFVSAHLSHRSEQTRFESADIICELVTSVDFPVVVAGDMNSSPPGYPKASVAEDGCNAMLTFDSSGLFQRSPADEPVFDDFTFPSDSPAQVIDWILVPKDWQVARYAVIRSGLSDHCPLVAEFAFGSLEPVVPRD